MKQCFRLPIAAFLAANLTLSCRPGPIEPLCEILTIHYSYCSLPQALTIVEDPARDRYPNFAHFYCYQPGRMVLYSPWRLDSAYFEPLNLPVAGWSIQPYTGPQTFYRDHWILDVRFHLPAPEREDFDFLFRIRVLF